MERYFTKLERDIDAQKDAEAERQYLISMTNAYHSSSEKFLVDFEMKMGELQANNEAAEKAAKLNIPAPEIPW